ncbi:MAG: CrcB family protein [Anaerobacillus sp.]
MKNSFAVAAGGAIGASLRAVIGTLMNGNSMSTLVVNVVGSILLGFFYEYVKSKKHLSDHSKKFIATGMLGSFTTFSTFSLDLFVYLREGAFFDAFVYGGASIVLGILGVILGVKSARKMKGDLTWNGS